MQDDSEAKVEGMAEDFKELSMNSGTKSGAQGETPKKVKSLVMCILISTHKNIFIKSQVSVQLYSSK